MFRAGVCEPGAEARQTRATQHNPEDSRDRGFNGQSVESVAAGQGASRTGCLSTSGTEGGGVLWSTHVCVMSLCRRKLCRDLRLLGRSILGLGVRPLGQVR
jgi:hypothetical protein